MCGLAGILTFNTNQVGKEILSKMARIMAHRGPDSEGTHISPDESSYSDIRIGLGRRRRPIIDLSPAGTQPMSNIWSPLTTIVEIQMIG